MKYSVDKRDTFCIMTLEDEKILSDTAPKLKSELVIINTEGYKNIILDMNNVEFIDSSGLSAILTGNRICKDANGTFVLTGINDGIKKLIDISQLNKVLNIIPTVTESVDYVMMEELERDLSSGK
jgi:anti-sigma B factor antagonist